MLTLMPLARYAAPYYEAMPRYRLTTLSRLDAIFIDAATGCRRAYADAIYAAAIDDAANDADTLAADTL